MNFSHLIVLVSFFAFSWKSNLLTVAAKTLFKKHLS